MGRKLKLTKNEKKVLKLLIEDSKISDSFIAQNIRISSQAVGKIRKKLENCLISRYSIDVQHSKLGIQFFAIALGKITEKGLERGELQIEQDLSENPYITEVYRIPKGNVTHIMMFGFKDVVEMDSFFRSSKTSKNINQFIEIQEVLPFSYHSIIKKDSKPLLHKAIDNYDAPQTTGLFPEIERFRKKL